MKIDYFTVMPSGPKGALETHCLTNGNWYRRISEEWERAIHYGAGVIRIKDKGAELRIPIEFGLGYVLQYLRQFVAAERHTIDHARRQLHQQLEWIGRGLPIQLRRLENMIELTSDADHRFQREPFLEAVEQANQSVS
ncbi:hypothetical protein QK289_14660 [Exiguobacterium antarcticum]|uniref:Uncharacterized protein n=1 Tax=Exiguobacterium antarcticum TaxID=132920 RepID=A0ABT6R5P4_9BACL|nr:hypothetical protein [Exiguobacterium antarcticum]MDI3236252.1 hypothetical protein [Exiguobacterium antarcticum]